VIARARTHARSALARGSRCTDGASSLLRRHRPRVLVVIQKVARSRGEYITSGENVARRSELINLRLPAALANSLATRFANGKLFPAHFSPGIFFPPKENDSVLGEQRDGVPIPGPDLDPVLIFPPTRPSSATRSPARLSRCALYRYPPARRPPSRGFSRAINGSCPSFFTANPARRREFVACPLYPLTASR